MEDWENKTTKKKKVELAFPKIKTEEDDAGEYVSKGRGRQQEDDKEKVSGLLERFSTSIEDVTDWFKQYQVDTIELWISGVIESAGVTRLVVSAKGEGGLRVVLKPKSQVA